MSPDTLPIFHETKPSTLRMVKSRRAALLATLCIFCLYFLVVRSHNSNHAAVQHQARDVVDEKSASSAEEAAKAANAAVNEASSEKRQGQPEENPEEQKLIRSAQKPLIDMSHMTTYEKLEYAYPYDVGMRFPNYIWQTWKYSVEDAKFGFSEQETSWTVQNPSFIHEVLTDEDAWNVIKYLYATVPEILETYQSLPLPVLKADFFRYLILNARGGVYTDIDTLNIQGIVNWLPEDVHKESIGLVIGIEADPDRPDWADWYSRRIQFCQWTIMGKPGHPVFREIITRITEEAMKLKRQGKLAGFQGSHVVDLTGPAVWTDTIMDYFNDKRFFKTEESGGVVDYKNFTGMDTRRRLGDVVVLPITSFSPGVEQMGSKDYDDPMAFVQHTFEGSWKPESERHIGEKQDKTK